MVNSNSVKRSITATLLLGALFFIISPTVSNAGDKHGNFGLGIILGEPTGPSAKYFLGNNEAIDFALAYSIDAKGLHIHSDYLYHFYGVFYGKETKEREWKNVALFVGAGGILRVASGSAGFAVRFPVGMEYIFAKVPIGVFLELALGVHIVPDTSFLFTGGIGARYYF